VICVTARPRLSVKLANVFCIAVDDKRDATVLVVCRLLAEEESATTNVMEVEEGVLFSL
jgi:hypothetical protein